MNDDIKVIGKNSKDILREAKAIVPHYTTAWDTSNESDSGVALLKIFSSILEDVAKRLDKVPEKNFIAFMDTLGFGLHPSQPSRVPLTFTVSEGVDVGIYISEKTQVGADATETRPELTFEVEPGKGFLATPSVLKKMFSVNPGGDEIFEHKGALEQGSNTELFTNSGQNLQEHIFYIGHDDLFNIKGQARIEFKIKPSNFDLSYVDWEYYGEKIEFIDGEEVKKEGWHLLSSEVSKLTVGELPGIMDIVDNRPVILIRGVGDEFKKRLKRHGITTIGELKLLTPEELAQKLVPPKKVKRGRGSYSTADSFHTKAANILEAAYKDLIDHYRGWYSKKQLEDVIDNLKKPVSKESRDVIDNLKKPGSKKRLAPPDTAVLSLESESPDGSTVLWKKTEGEIKEFEINNIKSRWVRCRIKASPSIRDIIAKLSETSISSMKVSIKPNTRDGEIPDMAFYNDVPLDVNKPFYPFGEIPSIYASFYIASQDAFSKKGTDITLNFIISEGEPQNVELSWEYWNGNGWTILEELTDNTDNFKKSNGELVAVTFPCPRDFEMTGVGGHENYWIRVRIVGGNYDTTKSAETNGGWQSKTTVSYQKYLFSWSKVPGGDSSRLLEFLKDYFGAAWVRDSDIKITKDDKIITISSSENLATITLKENLDMATLKINDMTHDFFVKKEGDELNIYYQNADGAVVGDALNMVVETDAIWQRDTVDIEAPCFTKILIAYEEPGRVPEHVITYNNLDYTEDSVEGISVKSFRPFEKLGEETQSLYLGFDKRLRGGPINIFFSLEERVYPDGFIPRFRWEYCGDILRDSWAKLDVLDETENLTKRGILSLVAPDDMSKFKRFGEELYWIRARLTGEQFEPEIKDHCGEEVETKIENVGVDLDQKVQPCEKPLSIDCAVEKIGKYAPSLKGIYVNTTWAFQTETVTGEILGSSNGASGQKYVFFRRPVINEEVWVNELSPLSVGERSELMEKTPSVVIEVRDADENLTEFWVKWKPVDDFLDSTEGDRHYVRDSTLGTVNFGDGVNGRVPPIGKDNIKANYQTGGGSAGNIKAGEIASLKSSLSFIDGVSNPELADGGADTETLGELIMRGPQHIKNRGHAIAREDFEWIAREASRKVARVKCIPSLDKECNFKPGWVTLIIVPRSREERPLPSVGLKRLVMRHVEERSAGVLTVPKRLVVKEPSYLGIAITAILVTRSIDRIPLIEKEALARVKEFLHPLAGGNMGGGWEFGRLPCLSDFYQLLEGIDGVDHVGGLSMEIMGAKKDQKIAITPETEFYPQVKPYNLVFSGEHDITVKYGVSDFEP